MSKRPKNDVAWQSLFAKHSILSRIETEGIFEISALEINSVREARLMTKFDHSVQLPAIFRDNKLSIQPNSRGTYVIGPFTSYFELPDLQALEVEEFEFPEGVETIDPDHIYSESAALLCAYVSGMIASLLGEQVRLTVMGRMGTGEFDYQILEGRRGSLVPISVAGAQCEIDAAFEGESVFAIVEAKNETVDDFLIRQVYYPYRLWLEKTSKVVVPIFMSYSNNIFSFVVFRFSTPTHYNSLEVVGARRYRIAARAIDISDIRRTHEESVVVLAAPESPPFPQADRFDRVVDLVTQLKTGNLTHEGITENYAFDPRQTDYYTNAARYIGLVEKVDINGEVGFKLTSRGSAIMDLPARERTLAFVGRIFQSPVFNQAFSAYLNQGEKPQREQIVEIMRSANLPIGGQSTLTRRAQTVLAWLDWILRLTRP